MGLSQSAAISLGALSAKAFSRQLEMISIVATNSRGASTSRHLLRPVVLRATESVKLSLTFTGAGST